MNPSGQDNVLGTANVKTLLKQLAIPAITAQVVNVLYNVVDRMYIGHIPDIGALALTGVGVCMPIIMLITAFAALVSMGSAPRASVLMGRSDNEEAHYTLGNSFIMLIIIALVLTVFFRRFAEPILMAFGASENTIGYAMDYMRIYTLGTIFVQFALGLNAFITAQGFAKISMATVVIGAVINIVLDPIFIFGFHMGVKGAALATILSQAGNGKCHQRLLQFLSVSLRRGYCRRRHEYSHQHHAVFHAAFAGLYPGGTAHYRV